MTLEELTRLDSYGHQELQNLDEYQLSDYATLLENRRKEVIDRIRKASKVLCRARK